MTSNIIHITHNHVEYDYQDYHYKCDIARLYKDFRSIHYHISKYSGNTLEDHIKLQDEILSTIRHKFGDDNVKYFYMSYKELIKCYQNQTITRSQTSYHDSVNKDLIFLENMIESLMLSS